MSNTPGIPIWQINDAREMAARVVRARNPTASGPMRMPPPPRASVVGAPQPVSSPGTKVTQDGTESTLGNIASHDTSVLPTTAAAPLASVAPFASTKARAGNPSNPQCLHCNQVIIPSPQASFPVKDTPSLHIHNWHIHTTKKPILTCPEIDALSDSLNLPIPEMIFGNNSVVLSHPQFSISFNAGDALATVNNHASSLQVAVAKDWAKARDGMSLVHKPYDWTYSTDYRGTCGNEWRVTDKEIPLEKLSRPDPILFFDEMVLFEDELADNGISVQNVKIRVMPERLLVLSRFFLRVDDVIFRIRDTRVYVDFKDGIVMREYKEQEGAYAELLSQVSKTNSDPRKSFRDVNWVSARLPVVSKRVEIIEGLE